MGLFEHVVDDYDAGRPGYPPGIYDALGPLGGLRLLEGGAGTGIATRALRARGARVIPFDVGPAMLRRAIERSPDLPGVVADGARLPFRDDCADLVCFAQSWHWLDPASRGEEAARVLRDGGRWAGWWSHARADGLDWFDRFWSLLESATVARREHRDTDWGQDLGSTGRFDVSERITVPWTREVTVETFVTEVASHSYVAALGGTRRGELLESVDAIVRRSFPDDVMEIRYETWMWTARVIDR